MENQGCKLLVASLVGYELASITFIRNYVQFGFDGPTLNAYAKILVRKSGIELHSIDANYYHEMVKLIGSKILSVAEVRDIEINIIFDCDACISISLDPEDRLGVEAAMFQDGTRWAVW